MLTDIWGKNYFSVCLRGEDLVHIFFWRISFWAYIQHYSLFQKTTTDSPKLQKRKKMHVKALIILPSLKCAIALLLYSLALSSFSLQFILIPSV